MKVQDYETVGALGRFHCSPVMARLVTIRESLPMHEASVTQGHLSPRDFRAPGANFQVAPEISEGTHKVPRSQEQE